MVKVRYAFTLLVHWHILYRRQVLLKHEADVDSTTDDGWTALHAAARYGDTEMVEVRYASLCWFTGTYCIDGQVLLEHGAGVNEVQEDGWTALHFAARCADVETVKVRYASLCWFTGKYSIDGQVLLEHEADVDSTTDDGWTVLQVAAGYGDTEMVKVRYAFTLLVHWQILYRRPGSSRAWSRRRLNHRRWMDCSAGRSPLWRRRNNGGPLRIHFVGSLANTVSTARFFSSMEQTSTQPPTMDGLLCMLQPAMETPK